MFGRKEVSRRRRPFGMENVLLRSTSLGATGVREKGKSYSVRLEREAVAPARLLSSCAFQELTLWLPLRGMRW